MIGERNPPAKNIPFTKDAIAPVQLAPLKGDRGVPSTVRDYTLSVRRPDLLDPLTRGLASVDTFGRGTFSVSENKSVVNILNALPRIVVAWPASQTQRAQVMNNKVRTALIPTWLSK